MVGILRRTEPGPRAMFTDVVRQAVKVDRRKETATSTASVDSHSEPMRNVDDLRNEEGDVVKHGEAFREFMSRMDAAGHKLLQWEDFASYYPNFPSVEEILLSEEDYGMDMDISPYMNTAALTIHHSTHVAKVQHIFRALGLRHLTVVNSSNEVVGVITRADLLEYDEVEHETDENGNRMAYRLSAPPGEIEGIHGSTLPPGSKRTGKATGNLSFIHEGSTEGEMSDSTPATYAPEEHTVVAVAATAGS